MSTDSQARRELQIAWEKVQALEIVGIEFGAVCYKWHKWYIEEKPKDKGDRIRFMWKSLGIPHTTAYYWMEEYAVSIGKGKTPEIALYTAAEEKRNMMHAANETRLENLFEGCDLPLYVKQNCATNEYHYNVVFSALTEKQVKDLAKRVKASR